MAASINELSPINETLTRPTPHTPHDLSLPSFHSLCGRSSSQGLLHGPCLSPSLSPLTPPPSQELLQRAARASGRLKRVAVAALSDGGGRARAGHRGWAV